MTQDQYTIIRRKCWDNALDAYGYSFIFNKRGSKYSRQIFWLNLFGLAVPVTVGLTAIGYENDTALLKEIIKIAIPLTIVQFLMSLFAILGKWDDELAYSYEASQSHSGLYSGFKKLAESTNPDLDTFGNDFNVLDNEADNRGMQDTKHNIKEWENRKGMRYALREFQRVCAGCNLVPKSMDSTDCPVCGKFSLKYKIL